MQLRGRPSALPLAGLAALVVLLHLAVISGSESDAPVAAVRAVEAMQMRVLTLSPSPARVAHVPPAKPARPTRAAVSKPSGAAIEHQMGSTEVSANRGPAPPATALSKPAEGPQTDVPIYRTHMPPPATLVYSLRRGTSTGDAELRWMPAGDRYEMKFEGRVGDELAVVQSTAGGFDDAGLAPIRYIEQRRRELRAVNFQREKGLITFSGPAVEYPLVPGAQDRLGWMIQLGAIVAAEPRLAEPGSTISIFVAGPRGDGEVWAFTAEGVESGADIQSSATVKFTREARRPYGTHAEIWLDPARNYLPMRVLLTTTPDTGGFELLLRDMR